MVGVCTRVVLDSDDFLVRLLEVEHQRHCHLLLEGHDAIDSDPDRDWDVVPFVILDQRFHLLDVVYHVVHGFVSRVDRAPLTHL